jgi:hypothetical protein
MRATIRSAIECKATRRPVERDDAISFAGKIHDLSSTIGIFISQSGFQPAAKKYLEDLIMEFCTTAAATCLASAV